MCKKEKTKKIILPMISLVFFSQIFIIIRLFQITDFVSAVTDEFALKISNLTENMKKDFIYQASILSSDIKAYQENIDVKLEDFDLGIKEVNRQLKIIINKINNTENNLKYSNIESRDGSSISYSDMIPP